MREADYSEMPSGDIILITHQHGDHFDMSALNHIVEKKTKILLTQKCVDNTEGLRDYIILKNGDVKEVNGIKVEAVPAYNIIVKKIGSHQWG